MRFRPAALLLLAALPFDRTFLSTDVFTVKLNEAFPREVTQPRIEGNLAASQVLWQSVVCFEQRLLDHVRCVKSPHDAVIHPQTHHA